MSEEILKFARDEWGLNLPETAIQITRGREVSRSL